MSACCSKYDGRYNLSKRVFNFVKKLDGPPPSTAKFNKRMLPLTVKIGPKTVVVKEDVAGQKRKCVSGVLHGVSRKLHDTVRDGDDSHTRHTKNLQRVKITSRLTARCEHIGCRRR